MAIVLLKNVGAVARRIRFKHKDYVDCATIHSKGSIEIEESCLLDSEEELKILRVKIVRFDVQKEKTEPVVIEKVEVVEEEVALVAIPEVVEEVLPEEGTTTTTTTELPVQAAIIPNNQEKKQNYPQQASHNHNKNK
jgi:hypothetical protein